MQHWPEEARAVGSEELGVSSLGTDCHASDIGHWLAMTYMDDTGRKESGEPKGWNDFHQTYLS